MLNIQFLNVYQKVTVTTNKPLIKFLVSNVKSLLSLSFQEVVSNLLKLMDVGKDHGVKRILNVGIPESAFLARVNTVRTNRDAINKDLQGHAHKSQGYVTYQDAGLKYDATSGLFEPDGLHFSPNGYRKFAEGIHDNVRMILDELFPRSRN